MAEERYYWLKLQKDFFKRHDIRIVEAMPNGKDYVLFYLKLLLESINHEGELRFSDTIPYNAEMLAVITNTNVDVVRSAMKVFCELKMMEIYDDQTIYLCEVQRLTGSETAVAERVRKHRERQQLLHCNADVTKCNIEKEIEKDKEIEIDRKKESIKEKNAVDTSTASTSKHKHGEYKHVLLTDDELAKLNTEYGTNETQEAIKYLDEYIEMKGAKYKSHYLALKKWVYTAVKEQSKRNTAVADDGLTETQRAWLKQYEDKL